MPVRRHLLYRLRCHPERSEGSAAAFERFKAALRSDWRRSDHCWPRKLRSLKSCRSAATHGMQRDGQNFLKKGRSSDDVAPLASCLQSSWHRSRRAAADPSTHHPQTEKRLGPRSLRMTAPWAGVGLSNYDANFQDTKLEERIARPNRTPGQAVFRPSRREVKRIAQGETLGTRLHRMVSAPSGRDEARMRGRQPS
jgi:hypothetical protein